jgi:hypothetical protein
VGPSNRSLIWFEGLLLGVIGGGMLVWLAFLAAPVLIAVGVWVSIGSGRRTKLAAILVGFGGGIALMTLVAASGCPAALGGVSPSCSGPDLRWLLVVAAGLAAAGAGLEIGRSLGSRRTGR